VISPILSNLFLHYVFDKWMEKNFPNIPFCRYADDGLTHHRSEAEALRMKEALGKRLVLVQTFNSWTKSPSLIDFF